MKWETIVGFGQESDIIWHFQRIIPPAILTMDCKQDRIKSRDTNPGKRRLGKTEVMVIQTSGDVYTSESEYFSKG